MAEAPPAGASSADLLIEIGCEELPADAIVPLAEHLGRGVRAALVAAGLAGDAPPATFATPRRIAARWPGVGARQPERTVERRGPAVRAAYDADGAPTKALAGFLRSAGAELSELERIETPKGEWVVLRRGEPGRDLAAVLGEALPEVVASMPMPRRMRWGDGDAEFLRPVAWLLALHGGETLPLELFGLVADDTTRGHRVHAPGPHRVADAADYEAVLESAYVVAEFARRRERVVAGVREAVARVEREGGGSATARRPLAPRLDPALVDEVTALVEWPIALAGSFDAAFLELPDEALIQTMEDNQRYFAVLDRDGKLTDAFVTVANLESTSPATVVDGNERVIRPRFADTLFFWRQDEKRRLEDFRPQLDGVLFQEKLGSVGDKVARLETLVETLAPLTGVRIGDAVLAASLCKCDLVSAIVEELPEMQGIAGRRYAERDFAGSDDESLRGVALAIETHYRPEQAGGELPRDRLGLTLALADRLDTLVGIYGQGLVPSGAKDPFGLRRAAIGILRIVLGDHRHRTDKGFERELALDVDLAELVAASARSYVGRLDGIDEGAIVGYVLERLRGHLVERGWSADAVDAVLAKGLVHPLDIALRLEAIERFRATDAAVALAAASKRVGNILRKSAGESGTADAAREVDVDALVEPAERALHAALGEARPDVEARLAARDYAEAMRVTAGLREPVDAFFDAVMVMDEDARLRANRLALLGRLDALCGATAELGRLAPGETTASDAPPPAAASAGVPSREAS